MLTRSEHGIRFRDLVHCCLDQSPRSLRPSPQWAQLSDNRRGVIPAAIRNGQDDEKPVVSDIFCDFQTSPGIRHRLPITPKCSHSRPNSQPIPSHFRPDFAQRRSLCNPRSESAEVWFDQTNGRARAFRLRFQPSSVSYHGTMAAMDRVAQFVGDLSLLSRVFRSNTRRSSGPMSSLGITFECHAERCRRCYVHDVPTQIVICKASFVV